MDMIWTNEHDRRFLANAGLSKPEHFWNLENFAATVEFNHLKSKYDRAGRMLRQVTCINANPAKYYVKKASGSLSKFLHDEIKHLKTLETLGITAPRLAAQFIDSSEQKILLIYKNLAGYNSLESLFSNKASPEALVDFSTRKRDIIRELLQVRKKIINSGHLFEAWDPSHVFVRQKSPGIALLDLEHLINLSELPILMKNPLATAILRLREWKRFKKTLGSKVYTDKFLSELTS